MPFDKKSMTTIFKCADDLDTDAPYGDEFDDDEIYDYDDGYEM